MPEETMLIATGYRPTTPTQWRTPSNPARSGFRLWVRRTAVLAFAGTLVAVGAVELHHRVVVTTGGPVTIGSAGTGQPVDVGVPFSLGHMLWNEGKEPAVVERVRVLGVTGPIEVIDVWARQRTSGPRHEVFHAAFGFPPPEFPSRPLAEEHVVPVPTASSEGGSPYEGLQLVVGVKSTQPGVGRIRGIEVAYRVGHRRYRTTSGGNGFLCSPAAEYRFGAARSNDCLGPSDDYVWDDTVVDVHVRPQKG